MKNPLQRIINRTASPDELREQAQVVRDMNATWDEHHARTEDGTQIAFIPAIGDATFCTKCTVKTPLLIHSSFGDGRICFNCWLKLSTWMLERIVQNCAGQEASR